MEKIMEKINYRCVGDKSESSALPSCGVSKIHKNSKKEKSILHLGS